MDNDLKVNDPMFCQYRHGLSCSKGYGDCHSLRCDCPYDENGWYPCKYSNNENVIRFLTSQNVQTIKTRKYEK